MLRSINFVEFSCRFLSPGVFYYAGSGSVPMKGVIEVLPLRTQRGPISLKIDGEAQIVHFI